MPGWGFPFINKLLSTRLALFIIVAIALLNKLFISISFYSLSDDKALYALLSLNAIDGNGFTETFYFIQDPGTAYFVINPTVAAPGYSFLLVPLLLVTGKNIFLSTIILEGLGWLLFFFVIRSILKYCSVSLARINVFTFLFGFYIYTHEIQSSAKDTLSLAFLLLASFYALRNLKNISSPVRTGALAAILALVPGFIKFIYMPLFFPVILMFLIAGYIKKEKKLISTFLWSLFFAALLFAIWYISISLIPLGAPRPFNYQDWSMTTEGSEFIRGIYPENLVNTFPFIVAAFCNMESWAIQVERLIPGSYSAADIFFRLLNLLLFIGLVVQLILFSLKIKKGKVTNTHFFIITGSLLSIFLAGLLFLMSILHKSIHYKGGTVWTYVSEPRSWLLIIVFIQLLVFTLLHQKFGKHHFLYKRFLLLAFFLILLESLHGFYFSIKTLVKVNGQEKEIPASTNAAILSDLTLLKNSYPDKQVELVAESRPFRWVSYLKGNKVYCNTPALAAKPDLIPPNTVLLIVIHEADLSAVNNYISMPGIRPAGRRGGYYLFIQESQD